MGTHKQNEAIYLKALLDKDPNYEIFLIHPEDIVIFHLGLSSSSKSMKLDNNKFIFEGDDVLNAWGSFYITYQKDTTRVFNCSSSADYDRKGKKMYFYLALKIKRGKPTYFKQNASKNSWTLSSILMGMVATPLGFGQC